MCFDANQDKEKLQPRVFVNQLAIQQEEPVRTASKYKQGEGKQMPKRQETQTKIIATSIYKYRLKSLFDSLPLFSFQNADLQSSDLLG